MKKVLWAVDAFAGEDSFHKKVLAALKAFDSSGDLEIEPVMLLLRDEIMAVDSVMKFEDYRSSAEKALESFLKKLKHPGLKAGRVIVSDRHSKRHAIRELSGLAQQEKFDMIAMATHARKGLGRFILGSFAETLLLVSTVPVFIVNPKSEFKKVKTILFPTDLTNASRNAFDQVIAYAQKQNAKVILFHQIPNPVEPLIGAGMNLLGGSYVPVRRFFDEEKALKTKDAEEWSKAAKEKKVKVEIHIELRTANIADNILKVAKKYQVSLISMASQVGEVESVLLGSITRQVIRAADCPVWAFHCKRMG